MPTTMRLLDEMDEMLTGLGLYYGVDASGHVHDHAIEVLVAGDRAAFARFHEAAVDAFAVLCRPLFIRRVA